MKTIVVNILGAAGAGKSGLAMRIAGELKHRGFNAEYVEEYVKKSAFEENKRVFDNQLMIFGNQYYSLDLVRDKADIIVTDSSLLSSLFYNRNEESRKNIFRVPDEIFDNLVWHCYKSFDNLNFYITRNHPYKQQGRYQDENRVLKEDKTIRNMIEGLNIDCQYYLSTDDCVENIIQEVLKRYEFYQSLIKSGFEIERKYLVSHLPKGIEKCKKDYILQGYLLKNGNEVRVRNVNNKQYYLTEKYGKGLQREEFEKQIDKQTFEKEMAKTQGRIIQKIRYYYPLSCSYTAEIDIYFGKNRGLKTVEVEFPTTEKAEAFEIPSWFGMDVTNDERYKNFNLSLKKEEISKQNTYKEKELDK